MQIKEKQPSQSVVERSLFAYLTPMHFLLAVTISTLNSLFIFLPFAITAFVLISPDYLFLPRGIYEYIGSIEESIILIWLFIGPILLKFFYAFYSELVKIFKLARNFSEMVKSNIAQYTEFGIPADFFAKSILDKSLFAGMHLNDRFVDFAEDETQETDARLEVMRMVGASGAMKDFDYLNHFWSMASHREAFRRILDNRSK